MAMPVGTQRAEATELSCAADAAVPMGEDAPLFPVMATMRAMRRLRPDPVPAEVLERLVQAATWAPSASDAQEYSFVVVTDPAQMARLGSLWRDVLRTYRALGGRRTPAFAGDPRHERVATAMAYQAEHFDETPAVIAVCYQRPVSTWQNLSDPGGLAAIRRDVGVRRAMALLSAASRSTVLAQAASSYPGMQNLLLAARAHGLAAAPTVWHLFRETDFKRVLGVPADVDILALVPVGYPLGSFGPVRRRPVADVLHLQRW